MLIIAALRGNLGSLALLPRSMPYSSKIIKAGALLPDTKTLLACWDDHASVQANLTHMLQANVFGKTSRSRVDDILAIFRQRYLSDPHLLSALVILVKNDLPAESLDRILYYLALRADPLLHDAVTQVLRPLAGQGRQEVAITGIARWLQQQVINGKTAALWGEETITRVAQGILATLRDFGILHGSMAKRLVAPYLPIPAFSFIAFLLNMKQRSGDRLLHDPEWQVFFLSPQAVERSFAEAHQERMLEYHAAGRVIRIAIPAQSIEEYALALAQRTH
jgi:hypothetical protein